MMRDLREKTKLIMIVVALAFVGLMVFEWGMDASGSSVAQQTGELGRVNGEPVPFEAYSLAYQQLYDQAQQASAGTRLSREEIRQLEEQAFNEVVNEILLAQELRRRGIRVSDQEVVQAAQWMPHPELMQNELFLTNGEFDISKYQQFLTSPAANEQLLAQLEAYYRSTIPRSKLIRQVTAGLHASDAELWQVFQDQNETATVDFVPLDIAVLVPGDVEVTAREIRDYYDDHEEEFERPASARVDVAYIQKGAAASDTVDAFERAMEVRTELAGGADFAELAERESDDPGTAAAGGDLGFFERGQMVPEFEEMAFSLPVGEVSPPVQTDYGYHIIEVLEREDERARARHILISYEPSEAALDRLYARADSLEMVTERAGIQRAASVMNATTRENVLISLDESFIPGIGAAVEAVEWARDEQVEEEPLDVSPVFETPQAFFIVELQEYIEPGQVPLEEATPEIRRQIILEKKREQARQIGEQIVAEVRAGEPLEQAASERGLSVQSAGPLTRTGFNPAFGQANAATGAAFGVPIGQVSGVMETPTGLFIVRPTARTEASREEFEAQKEPIRQFALMQLQQESISRWMEELRNEATIIDRRDDMPVAQSDAPPMMF
ncbi:MAG: peptidylprolyl isomerase [Gemmatimonadota bacterium]